MCRSARERVAAARSAVKSDEARCCFDRASPDSKFQSGLDHLEDSRQYGPGTKSLAVEQSAFRYVGAAAAMGDEYRNL